MMYLNEEMVEAARFALNNQDIKNLSEKFHPLAVSSIVQILAGRRKAKPEIIDTIMDWTKKKATNKVEKL